MITKHRILPPTRIADERDQRRADINAQHPFDARHHGAQVNHFGPAQVHSFHDGHDPRSQRLRRRVHVLTR